MNILGKWKFAFSQWLENKRKKPNLDCIRNYSLAIYSEAYIVANQLYPDNKLSANIDLATSVRVIITDGQAKLDEIDCKQQSIYLRLVTNAKVKDLISKYFLLRDFYLIEGMSENFLEYYESKDLLNARIHNQSAERMKNCDLIEFSRDIKIYLAVLKKACKEINNKRLHENKLNIIQPFKINSSHVGFVASIFTTLFILSGFLYNKIFFAYFGLSVGDFFTVSDYLGSSVDVISIALLATLIGVVSYFWGINAGINASIHNEEFEVVEERRGDRYLTLACVLMPIIMFIVSYLKDGELIFHVLHVPVMLLFFSFLYNFSALKYIENRRQVAFFIIVAFMFALNLTLRLATKIEKIVSGQYSAPYVLNFSEKVPDLQGYNYLLSNSSYVFLWNNETSTMKVILKSEVISFTKNNSDTSI